jgi:tripartite-type tricarboxylate transporter receptor subunit TctC
VQLIVSFPAGSAPDIIARLAGQHLSERLGQQFVIENRPGAGGNIATEYVAKAEPDGYTILVPVSTNAVNVALYGNLSFDFIRDIAPVAGIAKTPFVIVVPASFPAMTLSEFIAYLKANPGKVNVASGGIGTSPHVCGELFQLHARFARRTGAGRFQSDSAGPPADPRREAARPWGDHREAHGGAAGRPGHRRVCEGLRCFRVVWTGRARQDAA